MNEISFDYSDNMLTVFLHGHIDSANSSEAEAEILKEAASHQGSGMIVDAEDLKYISSAGLRVILRLKKMYPELKVVNVSSEVYEIFDMTGFTEIMDISKAYRVMSVEGCEVIGSGANGKVYRLDPDTIIKVYYNPDSLPDIQRERELARRAFVLGVPTAIPYDVVKVGEGYGSVFELLSAASLAEVVRTEPERTEEVVDMYVDLMKKIHSTEVGEDELPSAKEIALRWSGDIKDHIPAEQYEKLVSLIEAVPDRKTMIHGDYHLKNVMLQNGEALLIDMDTLCYGHPVFELAAAFLAYQGYSSVDHNAVKEFLGISYEASTRIWDRILKGYFDTEDEELLAEYNDKLRIISYVRIIRFVIRKDQGKVELLEFCKRELAQLLEKTESLVF